MNRRKFIFTAGATAAARAAASVRPDILIIHSDQFRADALAVSGNPFVHTPNLDDLARNGVRFSNAYGTQALCSPCRGSLLTGVYPHTTKVDHNIYKIPNALKEPEYHLTPHWPGLLREAGYHTSYIGKWHLGEENPGIFDYYNGYNSLWPHWVGKPYESPYRADLETDDAIRVIKESRSQPCALMVGYYPPHDPYTPPKKFYQYYSGKNLEHMEYYAAVSAIDWNVGRLLAALKETGREEDMLVIFTSDHGDTFGKRPGSSLGAPKTVCYDDSAKVPLIMRWPSRFPRGIEYRGGVSVADLMPTILDAAGVPIPSRVQGRSRIPDIQKGDTGWREPVFMENVTGAPIPIGGKPALERAVRTQRWKLILRDHPRNELYDITADPAEKNDLFLYPDFVPEIKELSRLIHDWGERLDDPVAVELSRKLL